MSALHCGSCPRDWPNTRDFRRCPVCLNATIVRGWAEDPTLEQCETERKHLAFGRYCRDRDSRAAAADKARADEGGRMIEAALRDVVV